jgi:alpha-ketoglutarate-dependent taurine dioxygenase
MRMSSPLQILRFHGPYLRDNCPCAACRHPETQQRTGPVHRASIAPASASWAPAGASGRGRVRVVWPDAHESEFDVAWLERYAYWREAAAGGGGGGGGGASAEAAVDARPLDSVWWRDAARDARGRVVWRARGAAALPRVAHGDFMSARGDGLARALRALRDWGLFLVEGCEASDGATEAACRRLGGLRRTLYGEGMWRTEVRAAGTDTAFSAAALSLHTDGNYLADGPPGVQVFHCTRADAAAGGGDSLLADGLAVAAELRARAPAAFELLARERIEYHHTGRDGLVRAARRVFELEPDGSGDVRSVAWNDDDRLPFEPPRGGGGGGGDALVPALYAAIDALRDVLTDEAVALRLPLRPGTVLFFDNTRVLHGRTAFDARSGRTLVGAYIGKDDWQSTLRMEELRLRREQPQAPA